MKFDNSLEKITQYFHALLEVFSLSDPLRGIYRMAYFCTETEILDNLIEF